MQDYLSVVISQGLTIGTTIFQLSVGTSSSYSGSSPDQDFAEDYPEIGDNVCWNPTVEDHHINMVAPTGAPSHNSSSRYPTIRGSEVSDARIDTPLSGDLKCLMLGHPTIDSFGI
jgi:hypothetical protein